MLHWKSRRLLSRLPVGRLVSVALCCVAWVGPLALRAAAATNETGVRLLQAELPARMTIPEADCTLLAHAVRRATLAHRHDAPAILSAALTRPARQNPRRLDAERPCDCVVRIFHASVAAAPDEASNLLEVASALYPACAYALGAGLSAGTGPDENGPAELSGFGVGFGPGFPGSPGFTGSSPSSAIALPPIAESPVVNG